MGRDPFSEKQDRVTFWPFFASELGELSTGLETGSVERKLKSLNHQVQDKLQARLGENTGKRAGHGGWRGCEPGQESTAGS